MSIQPMIPFLAQFTVFTYVYEMLVSLSEFSLLIINDGFANTKLSIQLGDDRDGKSNRYSSIGYSTLLFPEQTVVTSLKEMGKKDILGELQNSFRNQKFDAATVGSEVNAFLSEHKFHQFKDRLQIEEEGGKAIYEDFKFQGKRNQDTPLNDFLNSLEDQEKEYESKVFHKNIVPKIEGRQKKLVEDLHNKIQSKIDTEIDRSSRGINFAHAFSSVLVREDCDAITGQIIDEVSDLKSIEKSVLEFYRNQSDLPQLIEENKDLHKLYRNKERQFKKLSNDIQNLEEKVSVAQDSAVDASTLQTELNSKKQEWSKLEGELSTMRGEYENGKGKIESLKRELEHPEYRTRLREDDLANHQTKIQEHISILKNHEEKRNQHLDYLTELNKKKDKIFKKLLIWRPLMIFGIPILGFGLLEIFESEIMTSIAQMAESSRLEIYVELFLIALIAYGIWAFLHYRKNIGKELKQANIDLNALNKEKLDLYNEHVKLKGEIYRKRYDHIANASAYQGIHDLIELTEDNKKKLGNYKNEIYGIVGNAEEKIDGLHFDNNLFQSSVPEKEQIKHLKEDLSLQRFLSDKDGRTLNAYYTDYSQSGSTKKIEGDLDEYLTDMYRSLGNRTVMDYIYGRDQKIKENLNSSTRFKLLKEASEVYINLKDYGVGDQTEESAHFYTSNLEHPDADKSQQQLIASGLPTHSKYSTGDKNSVSLFRALKGFPAFQITLMDECRTIMDDLVKNNPDWKRSDFFIDPQYANESLFPSSLILGNASDEIRIAFAQGRALGIIEDGTKPFCFENVDLGNSIDECIKFLRSLKGEPIKDRLMKLIEQKLNGIKTSDQGKAVMHSVNDFLTAHPELDAVDKKILDTLMRSLV